MVLSNTLAYYNMALFTAVKSFIVQAPAVSKKEKVILETLLACSIKLGNHHE